MMANKIIRFLLLLLSCPVVSSAQAYKLIPLRNGSPFYELVIPAEGKTKEQLFNIAKITLIKSYQDASEVIQNEDKEAGNIIGKGYRAYSRYDTTRVAGRETILLMEYRMWFIVHISVKDNKYKLQLYDHAIEQRATASVNGAIAQGSWDGTKNSYKIYHRCATDTTHYKKKLLREVSEESRNGCKNALNSMHYESLMFMDSFITLMTQTEQELSEDW